MVQEAQKMPERKHFFSVRSSLIHIICISLESTCSTGGCDGGWQCKPREECPIFLEKQSQLKALRPQTTERRDLIALLKSLVCNKEEKRVCCSTDGGTLQKGFWHLPQQTVTTQPDTAYFTSFTQQESVPLFLRFNFKSETKNCFRITALQSILKGLERKVKTTE